MSALQEELESKTLQLCTAERAAENASRALVRQMVKSAFAKAVHAAELEDVGRRALVEKVSLLAKVRLQLLQTLHVLCLSVVLGLLRSTIPLCMLPSVGACQLTAHSDMFVGR